MKIQSPWELIPTGSKGLGPVPESILLKIREAQHYTDRWDDLCPCVAQLPALPVTQTETVQNVIHTDCQSIATQTAC